MCDTFNRWNIFLLTGILCWNSWFLGGLSYVFHIKTQSIREMYYQSILVLQRKESKKTNRRPGPAVTGGDSLSDGCGFKSQHHILDGHFLHIFVAKIVMFV